MIAVSLKVGGGVCLIIWAKLHVHAKHYKHNEGRRTAPDVCSNGSVPLSYSRNVVTRTGVHTLTDAITANLIGWTHGAPSRGYGLDGRTAPRPAAMDAFH